MNPVFRDGAFRWTIIGTIECFTMIFYFAWLYDIVPYPKPFFLPILSFACIGLFAGLAFTVFFMYSAAAHYVPGEYLIETERLDFPRKPEIVKEIKPKKKTLVQAIGELPKKKQEEVQRWLDADL